MATVTIVTGAAPILRDLSVWEGEPFDLFVTGDDLGDGVSLTVGATAGGEPALEWTAADGTFALEAIDLPAGASHYNVLTEHGGEDVLRAYGRVTRLATIRPTIAAADVSGVAALDVVAVQAIDDDPGTVQTLRVQHGARLQVEASPAPGTTLRLTLGATAGADPVAHFASTTGALNIRWDQLAAHLTEGGRVSFSLWEDDGADLRLMARGTLIDEATIIYVAAAGDLLDSGGAALTDEAGGTLEAA